MFAIVLCILMVEGMFIVVNVMLYLMSVLVKLCTLRVLALGVSLVS